MRDESQPDREAASLSRARALRQGGRTLEAIAELRAAVARKPNFAEGHHQLGNAYKSLGQYAEACASLRVAARANPGQAAIWLNLGVACLELRRLEEAIAAFRRALTIEPGRPEAHNILGHALLLQGRSTEAAAALEAALRLRPGYAAAHDNLGRVRKAQGRAAEAVAYHRAALAESPRAATHSNLLFSLNFLPGITPEEMLAQHRQWEEQFAGPAEPARPAAGPKERLRLGYVSPDFANHAVAFFLEPVLAHHHHDRFEIFCYSDVLVPDAVTQRLRGHADQWRDIARETDERVDAMIRADGIDLLVDLAGHTARNRLGVFARRPAPVQVTWLGYPNTTGLSAMDYRLTDSISDPPGRTEPYHSEQLVRLPETFSCYQPPADCPPVGTLPATAAGRVTFGCCHHLAKVTPAMIALWAHILRDLPQARLLLKARGLADAGTARRLEGEFAQAGVTADRLEFDGAELPTAAHLSVYHRIDIALDTAPYNGTTTTCEALWMGVPVVTLAGATHVSRVGASLLTHLGAEEWIASTPAEYRARCRALAQDLPLLAWLRQDLRDRLRRSPICAATRFTRQFEDTLRELWERRATSNSAQAPALSAA